MPSNRSLYHRILLYLWKFIPSLGVVFQCLVGLPCCHIGCGSDPKCRKLLVAIQEAKNLPTSRDGEMYDGIENP